MEFEITVNKYHVTALLNIRKLSNAKIITMAATAKVTKNPKERDMKPEKREPVNIPNPITVLKIPRS